MKFEHLGVMLDCSRNAVMSVSSVKKYIDILHALDYNTLMLYTEDTFEVNNQPYFGYLRGRYSKDEIREIDRYAQKNGIELIPCIQTLAHLNGIVRWSEYHDFCDIDDILLAGDERTYKLIEDIFDTLCECFTSRTVNLGMDEAHLVGLGKYLDRNGYHERTKILTDHISRVCKICASHGFKPLMWSDMFFRLAAGGYYHGQAKFDKKVINSVPPELGLIYWDYYSKDKAHYDEFFSAHKQFKNEIWFAGGLWCWNGFAPRNGFSIDTIDAVMPSIEEQNIKNVIFTVWGDDGRECSPFAVLPSLYYAAKKANGINDNAVIKKGFFEMFGVDFDDFMLLDLPDTTDDWKHSNNNPEKYMTYNDCFCGIFDCTIPDEFSPRYSECAKRIEKLTNGEYGYLFDSMKKLCDFLQIKYTLGIRTRKAYRANNTNELKEVIADYKKALLLLESFFKAHKKVWFTDNKPFGFDVQEIHIGGLMQRIKSCGERLEDYTNGKISEIPELDEDILPEFKSPYMYFNDWRKNASVNVMTHEHY